MDSGALHTSARRYLMARYDELTREYSELPRDGRARDGYHYTTEAKRLFPRYNVVEAMLVEVERLDPDALPEPLPLADALRLAADTARSPMTEASGGVEARAIEDERRLFRAAVDRFASGVGLDAAPLGYRRVLGPAESADWRARLAARWGVVGTAWHPVLVHPVPDDVLVLREEAMWEEEHAGRVRRVLRDLGVGRVVELREHGVDHLLDLDLFAPTYTGAQGVWTDSGLDWVAHASHEWTVAFGGSLATALPAAWPDVDAWRRHG